jgi:hypothetical protein
VGAEASEIERGLDRFVRLSVGVERSNALRLQGRFRDAIRALDGLDVLADPGERGRLMRNKAILLRDVGEPDRSIEILEAMLPGTVGADRLDLIESLVVSHSQLGHRAAVAAYLEEALSLAAGPLRSRGIQFIANSIGTEANNGDVAGAVEKLERLEWGGDVLGLMSIAGAWVNVLRRDPGVESEALRTVTNQLADYVSDDSRGPVMYRMTACRALAVLREALDDPEAVLAWEAELTLRRAADSPDPLPLVALARYRLDSGDELAAESLLLEVPHAMAHVYGGVAHAGIAIDATVLLRELLESLAEVAMAVEAGPALRRVVAELQRDGAGRAQLVRLAADDQREQAALTRGLGDESLRQLAPESHRLHVVDWFSGNDRYYGQRTIIDATGQVDLVPLHAPDFDLWPVAERIRGRLDGWHPRRKGDPFGLPEWVALESWFRDALRDVEAGDHVVVIDHPEHAGIPWHAIRECGWTTSFAPGWSSLLTLRRGHPSGLSSIGVVVVPADEDSASVVDALDGARDAIRRLGRRTGRTVLSCEGANADGPAVEKLLNSVDVAVLLCHGFAAPGEQEVALMLSSAGALPTTHAVAAGSVARRAHRWSWREAARLTRAPGLVISAACSSGTSHLAGLGERLGLYGSLRLRGTEAVLAPQWDVVAADARDFVTACLEAHLERELPLADAARAASRTLERNGVPEWRRSSFSLEGDWR